MSENRMRLSGKVAIVTGAGTGIGKAIAVAFSKEGAGVVINDIDGELAIQVAKEIQALGYRAQAIRADVSDSAMVHQMVAETIDSFGRIDVLVNNAGILLRTPTEDLTEAEWDRIIDVNLKGTFLCCQAVGRQMIKQKGGKIINLASSAAQSGSPAQAAYNSSKGGVLQLTRVLAVEWAKHNIYVNTLSPGMTETPMVEKTRKKTPWLMANRLKRVPFRRFVNPENLAQTALFLASSESDDMSGQEIRVDCAMSVLYSAYIWPDEHPR